MFASFFKEILIFCFGVLSFSCFGFAQEVYYSSNYYDVFAAPNTWSLWNYSSNESLSLGTMLKGDTEPLEIEIELRNTSKSVLPINIQITGPFVISTESGATSLPKGGNHRVKIKFQPTTVGEQTGKLTWSVNRPGLSSIDLSLKAVAR